MYEKHYKNGEFKGFRDFGQFKWIGLGPSDRRAPAGSMAIGQAEVGWFPGLRDPTGESTWPPAVVSWLPKKTKGKREGAVFFFFGGGGFGGCKTWCCMVLALFF